MKKKFIFISISVVILLTIFILFYIITDNKNNINNNNFSNIIDTNYELQIENLTKDENIVKEDTNEVNNIQNKKEDEIQANINESKNDENTNNTSLPNDIGLTVNGVPKTFNQDIMAKANIAYLLGCENITDTTDLEEYIYNHIPNNGIFISERTLYPPTGNPYEHTKERATIMKEMLSYIHLKYDIDKNNYLLGNEGNGQLEQQLNKLIYGNKKIIIGFVAEYYTYINDSEYGLQLGGGFGNSSYVSFKPYNEIYAYIFDENSSDIDSFYTMIEEISNLAE